MREITPLEKKLFLEGIFLRYGYDFHQYTESAIDRRLYFLLEKHRPKSILEILDLLIHDPVYFREILPLLTVKTTEFFRDPGFFMSLRKNVIPLLKTYSRFTIWVAGCSTGEEVISLAILLQEENLLKNATIHATDINPIALKTAQSGIYEMAAIKTFNKNYVTSGGTKLPSDYFTAAYGLARFDPELLKNVVFSEHNLTVDAPFVEAQLITCRNVLIYFDKDLQNRVFQLFASSLSFKGFLGIGAKESLRFADSKCFFSDFDLEQKIYSLKTRCLSVQNSSLSRTANEI